MAWALRFSGSQRVQLQSDVFLDATSEGIDWRIELDFESENQASSATGWISGSGSSTSRFLRLSNPPSALRVRVLTDTGASTNADSSSLTWVNNERYTLSLFCEGGNVGIERNDTSQTIISGPRNFQLRFIGDGDTTNNFRGLMYQAKVFIDGELAHHWINQTGSGNVWTDIVGGVDANLIGTWPTDDSQWVPYGEPSEDIDATIALTMPQFGAAVSAASTAPGVSASVAFTMPQFAALVDAEQQAPQYAASVALTMPQFTAAITGEASAPTAGATVAFAMPQFIAAATADSLAPQYPASASFTMPQFTAAVQAEATAPGSGASVSFVMPQFTAAATAETTVPEFPAVAAFAMPQFGVVASAEASLPATGAVVAYAMPQFTVAASGASTVPTITADVAYTMPQFGVMVLTDETPIGTAPGARLAWVAGSNKLAYNVGSNRLSWRA